MYLYVTAARDERLSRHVQKFEAPPGCLQREIGRWSLAVGVLRNDLDKLCNPNIYLG